MNRIHRSRRSLAGLTRHLGVLLAYGAAVPAALATWPPLPPGWNKHPPLPVHTHTVATGGMPGWQITLIAVAATLLAAALAVTVHRMRAARRRVAAGTCAMTEATPAPAAAVDAHHCLTPDAIAPRAASPSTRGLAAS